MSNSKVYIFKEGRPFSGHSKETGNPFTLRILHFVDPETFDVHRLMFHDSLDATMSAFKNGDRINIDTVLEAPRYQNRQSSLLVTGVWPAK